MSGSNGFAGSDTPSMSWSGSLEVAIDILEKSGASIPYDFMEVNEINRRIMQRVAPTPPWRMQTTFWTEDQETNQKMEWLADTSDDGLNEFRDDCNAVLNVKSVIVPASDLATPWASDLNIQETSAFPSAVSLNIQMNTHTWDQREGKENEDPQPGTLSWETHQQKNISLPTLLPIHRPILASRNGDSLSLSENAHNALPASRASPPTHDSANAVSPTITSHTYTQRISLPLGRTHWLYAHRRREP
ncbi:hypothetical protein HYPSUDRAFT_214186 [Hypholoma sublateritium FD-334 SS-4]|uniref:Uncharacterized protein n=1 Tax=Hypholoma sublateritium (strain FD-334 SS-4) TaxID=945553 RepID=A0A0D2LCY4_HYPSF|nr:hypothetical protein HYPSUDRAFT_214186 [Hypholoma sublateritium FD-334 SS-4]